MFGQRTLRRIVQSVVSEAPPRSPEERERLARPRTPEAAQILRFLPALESLPVDPQFRELLPAARMILEGVALDCEEATPEAAEARERVRVWVEHLKRAVA